MPAANKRFTRHRRNKRFESLEDRRLMTTVTFREGGGGIDITDITFDDTSAETWGAYCLTDSAGGGTPSGSCGTSSDANNPNYLYANRIGLVGVKDLFNESWATGSPNITSAFIELVGPSWDTTSGLGYVLRSVDSSEAWMTGPRGQNEVGTFPSSIGESDYGTESIPGTWLSQGQLNRIEITDLVVEMMAQGDDFALAITVPSGTLKMFDSEHTNLDFRPKIEINYGGDPPPDTIPPSASASATPSPALAGGNVTLNVDATDNVSDPAAMTYAWTQASGPSVTLVGSDTASPTFQAPASAAGELLTFNYLVADEADNFTLGSLSVPVVAPGAGGTVTYREGGGGTDITDVTFDDTSAETWGAHCLTDSAGGGTPSGSCGTSSDPNNPNYLYANRVGLVGVKDLFNESWAAGSPSITSAFIELVGPSWDTTSGLGYVLRSVDSSEAWMTGPRGQNEVGTFPSSIGEADYGTESIPGTWLSQGQLNRIEITDLVAEMMSQGDDFALAITVPSGTLKMFDSEHTNLDFRPKIEINYASASSDSVVANDFSESMISLGVETFDLASHVTASGPVTYEVISNSGGGAATIDGSELSYAATIGDDQVVIQYRATSGTASDVGNITVTMTAPETIESLRDHMLTHLQDIPGYASDPSDGDHFYFGSYAATAFREIITAARNSADVDTQQIGTEMWGHFKTWVDNFRNMPKNIYHSQPGNTVNTTALENIFGSVDGTRTATSIDLPGHFIGIWNVGDTITVADWLGGQWSTTRRDVNAISFDGAKTTIEFDAVSIPANATGAYVSYAQFPSPWQRFGASGSYERPKFIINFKQESQWAYNVLWTLHRAIKGDYGFSQAERDWAVDAWHYIHRNSLEFHYSVWGNQGAGFEGHYFDSAVAGVPVLKGNPSCVNPANLSCIHLDTGYFGSTFITTVNAAMIDRAINEYVLDNDHLLDNLPDLDVSDVQREGALYSKKGTTTEDRWRPVEWAEAWLNQIEGVQVSNDVVTTNTSVNNGKAIWDTGKALWGGSFASPSVGHTHRHIELVWMADELGHFDTTELKEAFTQTFAQNIVLDVPYTYQSGNFAGQQTHTQTFANYLDGTNGQFRNYVSTYTSTNESTNGFVYTGWYLAGISSDLSKHALARVFHESQVFPDAVDRSGTWYRHNFNAHYAQFGLAASMIAIEAGRGIDVSGDF